MDLHVDIADERRRDDRGRAALRPLGGIGQDTLVSRALENRRALELVAREMLRPALHRLVARRAQESRHGHALGEMLLVVPAVPVLFLVGGNVGPHHQETRALLRSRHVAHLVVVGDVFVEPCPQKMKRGMICSPMIRRQCFWLSRSPDPSPIQSFVAPAWAICSMRSIQSVALPARAKRWRAYSVRPRSSIRRGLRPAWRTWS